MLQRIRIKYYPNILNDIKKWRSQGFKGEIIIYDSSKGLPAKRS